MPFYNAIIDFVVVVLWIFSHNSSSLNYISQWSCDETCQSYHKRLDQYCHRSVHSEEVDELFQDDREAELPGDIAKNFELQHVHIVARHGDRSPIQQQLGIHPVYYECGLNTSHLWAGLVDFPQFQPIRYGRDEVHSHRRSLFPGKRTKQCGTAMLTREGFYQHRKLGYMLSSRYSPFLFKNYKSTQQLVKTIYVQSTDTSRTIHSAGAFMLGFLPDLKEMRQQVVIHVSPGVLLHAPPPWVRPVFRNCKNLDSFAVSQLWKTSYHQTELTEYTPVFELLLSIFRQTSFKRLPPREVFDSVVTRGCHVRDNPLPCSSESCLDYESANKLFEYIDWTFINSHTPMAATLAALPFLRHSVYETMRGIVQKEDDSKKFILSVSHDTIITQYLIALGVSIEGWMPYASRVAFELWKSLPENKGSSDPYYVRVLFNGVPVTHQLIQWRNKESSMEYMELLPFSSWEEFMLKGKYRDVESYNAECTKSHPL